MNNASKSVVRHLAFDGMKASFSQLIFNPDLMGRFSAIVVEEIFWLVDVWKMTSYTLSLFLEQSNENGYKI